jgi:membrane protein YqaA with SNARE-associated domain
MIKLTAFFTGPITEKPLRQERMDDSPKINIRRMLIACLVVYCVMSVCIVILRQDHTLYLLLYFTYMAVACTFFPLPTLQMVMIYAERYDPISMALLGGIAFCISALIDYSLVTFAFRYDKIARVKNDETYRWIERLFSKCPPVSLAIAAFTPIPLEPVKLIACANRYNRAKFLLACFVGRTPRYYLLGKLQTDVLHIPGVYLYGSIIVLVAIEVIRRLMKRARVQKAPM